MANPRLIFREDLTTYSFAILADYQKVLTEAKRIAPVVPTGVLAGRYAKFDSKQDFALVDTRRAAGGETAVARYAADMVDFNLDNNALKIPIDEEIEIPQAGGNASLVERAKLHTLLAQSTQGLCRNVYSLLKAGITPDAALGHWGDSSVDPIDELEQAGFEIFEATGLYPNQIDMTPQMLRLLRKNPLSLKRFPGKQQNMSLDLIVGELSFPCTMNIVTGAGLTGGNFGNDNASFAPLLGTAAWLYFSNPLATGQNPSFAVTLSQSEELISGVYEYLSDDGTVRFLRVKWQVKPVVQSTKLVRRIDFQTGAAQA